MCVIIDLHVCMLPFTIVWVHHFQEIMPSLLKIIVTKV